MAGFTAPFRIAEHAEPIEQAFYVPKHVEATIPSNTMPAQFDVYASQASCEAGDQPLAGASFSCTVPLSDPSALLSAVFGDIVTFVKKGGIPQIAPDAAVVV